ncbi:MAG: hypothetical protein FJX30_06390 [Alphaproteobacteria bacterium]|nr:hypothetical protein [Bacteroidota bacterium]MBM3590976.1 hypothetical protein [Alphaproteobacteria bacterium]
MKNLYFVFLFLFTLSGCAPTELSEVTNIDAAKKRVDWLISKHIDEYNSLCSQSRNDATKLKFENLKFRIDEYWTCGEKCIKLDAIDQNKVTKYAIEKLESNKGLITLSETGFIDCW